MLRHHAVLATIVALLMLSFGASGAQAAVGDGFGIAQFDGSVTNQDGTPFTQAGGHPYAASTTIKLNATTDRDGIVVPDGDVKTFHVDLPPGFVGNPTVPSTCTDKQLGIGGFNAYVLPLPCPVTSQVGLVVLDLAYQFGRVTLPVFNMPPPPGYPAQFGFNIMGQGVAHLLPSVRSGSDYGLTVDVVDITTTLPILANTLTLWGVPADPSHDPHRMEVCALGGAVCFHGGFSANTTPKPFLTNPSDCAAGPLTTHLTAQSWQHPDQPVFSSFVSNDGGTPALPLGVSGCDRLPFAPSMHVGLGTTRSNAPTGLSFGLSFPTDGLLNPDGVATAYLKDAKVTLPEGMTINPSGADGLTACADADLRLTSESPMSCPESSKVGSATATSPLLNEPLTGGIYIRSQSSSDPQSGDMYRVALVLENKRRGLSIRLPGSIKANPQTGRLETSFINNPQLPLGDVNLTFKDGPRAPLAMPATCGTKTITAHLTAWSGQTADLSDSFTVDQGCDQAGRFEPSMQAGLVSPQAGGSSPFTMTLSRSDGQQDISGLDVTLPAGVLGNVGSVPQCPEAQAAAGTCAAASRVGTTTVAAGAGSSPLSVPQAGKAPTAVYLAGPYKGAPFSLSIVVPAQAGPFDLGNVVVRAALFIDPLDAHVTVVSDPIPTIVGGVPLRVQKINVTMDRPGFMVSPTSCDPMQVAATVRSAQGASVAVANRLQMADCASLGLTPKLAIGLTGKGQTNDGKHPGVQASLTMPAGGANLEKMVVTLPSSLALDPDNSVSDGLCSFVEGSKPNPVCPASSIVGKATAVTPVLDQPLSGPVYFVKNERKDPKSGRSIKTTPKLVIPLTGQNGVKLTLTGASSVPDNEHLVTTFDNIPDAPVSSFKLDINGGKKGILVVSGTDVCKSTQIAEQAATGQNGKTADADITLSTPCALAVVASSHTASALKLTVGGIGAGKVSVSGKGLTKTTRTITSATTATLAPKLSKANRSRLAHGHDVKVKVTVSFTPKGAKKAKTAHKAITIHGSKKQ